MLYLINDVIFVIISANIMHSDHKEVPETGTRVEHLNSPFQCLPVLFVALIAIFTERSASDLELLFLSRPAVDVPSW